MIPLLHGLPQLVFFLSSRRRHTRLVSDWSSDVCSSDLRASIMRTNRALGSLSVLSSCVAGACSRPRSWASTTSRDGRVASAFSSAGGRISPSSRAPRISSFGSSSASLTATFAIDTGSWKPTRSASGPRSSGVTFSFADSATARFASRFLATRQRPWASRTVLRRRFIWPAVRPRYSASTVRVAREDSSRRVPPLSTSSERFIPDPLGGRARSCGQRIDAHRRPHRRGERDALHVLPLGRRGLRPHQAREQGLHVVDQLGGAEAPLADRDVHDARLCDAGLDLAPLHLAPP